MAPKLLIDPVVEKRIRTTITESILVNRPPETVFDFLRCIGNLSQWSSFRNIVPVEANLYQAEDSDGACRFFWIEDERRQRVILHQTGHQDRPCLVLSISGGKGAVSLIHYQYSSHKITEARCRRHARQARAMKKLIESAVAEGAERQAGG